MTPTTRTGCRSAAATLKYTAEPPRASAVSPNGVNTESSATLPTTTRLMGSHPVGGRETEQSKPVAEHDPRGPRQHQPGPLRRLRLAEHPAVVIPVVGDPREVLEVPGDPVRLARRRRSRDDLRKAGQLLEQLQVLR